MKSANCTFSFTFSSLQICISALRNKINRKNVFGLIFKKCAADMNKNLCDLYINLNGGWAKIENPVRQSGSFHFSGIISLKAD